MGIRTSTPIGSIVYYTHGSSVMSALLCGWTLDMLECILFGLQKENRIIVHPHESPSGEVYGCFEMRPDELYLDPMAAIDGDLSRRRSELKASLVKREEECA